MIWYGGRERTPGEMAAIVVEDAVETARNNLPQFFSRAVDPDIGQEFPEPIESEMEKIKNEMDELMEWVADTGTN